MTGDRYYCEAVFSDGVEKVEFDSPAKLLENLPYYFETWDGLVMTRGPYKLKTGVRRVERNES